jgi:hypothetical protein
MKVAMGQPAEHLPHWKQRRTDVPDKASTLRTKLKSIVSCEMTIFFLFTIQSCPFMAERNSHNKEQKPRQIYNRLIL